MSIDKSGKWWVGAIPEDIKGFLEASATKGYEVHEFRMAKCICRSLTFQFEA